MSRGVTTKCGRLFLLSPCSQPWPHTQADHPRTAPPTRGERKPPKCGGTFWQDLEPVAQSVKSDLVLQSPSLILPCLSSYKPPSPSAWHTLPPASMTSQHFKTTTLILSISQSVIKHSLALLSDQAPYQAPNPVDSREAPPTSRFPDFSEPPGEAPSVHQIGRAHV